MTTPDHVETPSESLARRIVERLVREQLISTQAAASLQPKLAEGKVRAEDWRLPVELGGDKERGQ